MLLGRGTLAAASIPFAVVLISVLATAQQDPGTRELPAAGGPADSGGSGGAGGGSLRLRGSFYANEDHDAGNPFLDESETVIEPAAIFTYRVTDRLQVNGSLSYDLISSASMKRLSRVSGASVQSGASGDRYLGGQGGFTYSATDDFRFGLRGGASDEYDYFSIAYGGNVAFDVAQRDATIDLSFDGFYDTVHIVRWDGTSEGNDLRLSMALTASYYQILTPVLHGEVGATVSQQRGFLETAFNSVVIEDPNYIPPPPPPPPPGEDDDEGGGGRVLPGYEIAEELPDARTRVALFGRVRRYFETGTGLEAGVRLYGDSWGIWSVAVEPRLYQWLVGRVLMLRVRYRFYVQTAARYWAEHFAAVERYRTQDSDLGEFFSNSMGIEILWHISDALTLDVSGDYVLRSDGLDQILFSFGLTWEF